MELVGILSVFVVFFTHVNCQGFADLPMLPQSSSERTFLYLVHPEPRLNKDTACTINNKLDRETSLLISVKDFDCVRECNWKIKVYVGGCPRREFCCEPDLYNSTNHNFIVEASDFTTSDVVYIVHNNIHSDANGSKLKIRVHGYFPFTPTTTPGPDIKPQITTTCGLDPWTLLYRTEQECPPLPTTPPTPPSTVFVPISSSSSPSIPTTTTTMTTTVTTGMTTRPAASQTTTQTDSVQEFFSIDTNKYAVIGGAVAAFVVILIIVIICAVCLARKGRKSCSSTHSLPSRDMLSDMESSRSSQPPDSSRPAGHLPSREALSDLGSAHSYQRSLPSWKSGESGRTGGPAMLYNHSRADCFDPPPDNCYYKWTATYRP